MLRILRQSNLILISLTILLNSCKKNDTFTIQNHQQSTINDLKSLVNSVKVWHDSVVKNNTISRSENYLHSMSLSTDDIVVPYINWSSAFINYDSSSKKCLTINLSENIISGELLQMVVMKAKDTMIGYIIKTIPDSSYYSKKKSLNNYQNYSGLVLIYDLKGKFIFKTRMQEGSSIKTFSSGGNTNLTNIKSNEEINIDELTATVTGIRYSPYLYIYVFGNSNSDCLDFYIPVGTGGGSQSGDATTSIRNNIANPCLSGIVDKITNSKISDNFFQKFQSIFGKTNKINLNFNEGTNPNNTPAQFTLKYENSNQIENYTITLDVSKMKDASDEYIASCIVHEIAHALIRNSYSDVIVYNKLTQPGRHYEMLINYATLMKDFLKDSFNIDGDDAFALIFTGISDLNTDIPNLNSNVVIKEQWTQDFKDMVTSLSNLSTDRLAENYYVNLNEQYQKSNKGTKGCNF